MVQNNTILLAEIIFKKEDKANKTPPNTNCTKKLTQKAPPIFWQSRSSYYFPPLSKYTPSLKPK